MPQVTGRLPFTRRCAASLWSLGNPGSRAAAQPSPRGQPGCGDGSPRGPTRLLPSSGLLLPLWVVPWPHAPGPSWIWAARALPASPLPPGLPGCPSTATPLLSALLCAEGASQRSSRPGAFSSPGNCALHKTFLFRVVLLSGRRWVRTRGMEVSRGGKGGPAEEGAAGLADERADGQTGRSRRGGRARGPPAPGHRVPSPEVLVYGAGKTGEQSSPQCWFPALKTFCFRICDGVQFGAGIRFL